jgi:hypothetical protein
MLGLLVISLKCLFETEYLNLPSKLSLGIMLIFEQSQIGEAIRQRSQCDILMEAPRASFSSMNSVSLFLRHP